MKRLGIIGGLGPMASAYFMQLVIQMTDAKIDQEHIETILYSCPSIPDRTQYIIGESTENPLPKMCEVGKGLVQSGAEIIAIPCVTAHYFHDELEKEVGVSVIHAIKETAEYLKERNITTVGVMATDGTVQSGLFSMEMEREGIHCIYPSPENQKLVMSIIYDDVKSGKRISMNKLNKVASELFMTGAQVILLGCTELSIAKRDYPLSAGFLDVMEVLAKCSVEQCGTLKKEYEELITRNMLPTIRNNKRGEKKKDVLVLHAL